LLGKSPLSFERQGSVIHQEIRKKLLRGRETSAARFEEAIVISGMSSFSQEKLQSVGGKEVGKSTPGGEERGGQAT